MNFNLITLDYICIIRLSETKRVWAFLIEISPTFVMFIKVFRLQRKTLLLFFGFFFSIIIKVFRFQRKTLLLLYCFFFSFFYFSYRFCAEHFLKSVGSIFMKFSGLIDNHQNLIYFFLFWWRHFRFWEIAIFLNFRGSRCPDFSSKTKKAS